MNLVVTDSATQPLLVSDNEWECKVCCVQNSAASDQCVNCKANRACNSTQNTENVAKVSKLHCCIYSYWVVY